MFPNVFPGGSPSREIRASKETASYRQERPPSLSPEVPKITSDILDPPAQQLVTSGLTHTEESQSARHTVPEAHQGPHTPVEQGLIPSQPRLGPWQQPQLSGSAPASGRSRIEVVLNVSPLKPVLDRARYYDAADLEDELPTSNSIPRKQKRGHEQIGFPRTQATKPATTSAPVTPAGPPATGKRPRGRPKGWRPGMPSTKTGRLTASAYKYLDKDGKVRVPALPVPKNTGPKRRGRPPRQPSPTPRRVWEKLVAPPQYVPFRCEWPSCKAELQNVGTLRRHIRIVHGRADPLVCRWAGCDGRSPEFTQDYEFQDHVDEMHLVPFVWHVGDGPRNERCMVKQESDPDYVPTYLLGADGEQVTPSIKSQTIEDFPTWRENRRRLRQIILQRDANAPLEEEDEDDSDEVEDDGQVLPV